MEQLNIDLLRKYYQDFLGKSLEYGKMRQYYDSKHDIDTNYTKINERANHKSTRNFIAKFVDDETSFTVGKPLNYISISNNEQAIKDIEYNLTSWSKKHDIDLTTDLGIYREIYEVYYIDEVTKDFKSILLNPANSYLLLDEFNRPSLLFRVFKQMFDETIYIDVWTKSTIYHFNDSFQEFKPSQVNIFGEIPVGFGSIRKTIYDKIKSLQDDYNVCNSDQINLLSDLRFFYLIIHGIDPTDEKNKTMVQNINQNSILFLNGDAKIDKLEKTINDAFLQNVRNNCKDDMYELVGHINMQKNFTSNTSGEQIVNRLLQLQFRCTLISATIQDIVQERVRFLFKYLSIKNGKSYDYKDVSVKITPNIQKDWTTMANVISQIGDTLSTETKISLLPLDHSPAVEIAKLKQEQEDGMLNLDNIPTDENG